MQYVLLIYQGTTPLPDTDAWASLPAAEQQAIYADYAALNARPGVTPGLPLGLAEKAKTVRIVDGTLVAVDGPYAEPVEAARAMAIARIASRSAGTSCSKPTTSTPPSRWQQAYRRPATAGRSRSGRSKRTGDRPRFAR